MPVSPAKDGEPQLPPPPPSQPLRPTAATVINPNEPRKAPCFVEEPEPKQISPNEVVFRGRVTGNPIPQIEWTVDGRPLVEGEEVLTSSTSEGTFELRLINVQMHDTGRYTCTAFNEYGQASSTNVLYLRGKNYSQLTGWKFSS